MPHVSPGELPDCIPTASAPRAGVQQDDLTSDINPRCQSLRSTTSVPLNARTAQRCSLHIGELCNRMHTCSLQLAQQALGC